MLGGGSIFQMWEERRRNGEALPPLDCLLISFLPPKCSHPSSSSSCRHLLHAAAVPPLPTAKSKAAPAGGLPPSWSEERGENKSWNYDKRRRRLERKRKRRRRKFPLSVAAASFSHSCPETGKGKSSSFSFPAASFSPPFYFLPLLFFVSAFVRLPRGLRREGGRGRKKKEVPSPTSSSPGRTPRTHFLLSVVVELCRRTVTSAHQRGSTVPGRVLRGRSHAIS